MQIEDIRLEELIPYENNPRDNGPAVEAVAASISEFGFKVPIVIDSNNVIVAGHTRLLAAKGLGRKCFMMELDPKYCDVIVQRWEKLTGEKAVRINGETGEV